MAGPDVDNQVSDRRPPSFPRELDVPREAISSFTRGLTTPTGRRDSRTFGFADEKLQLSFSSEGRP